MSNISAPLYITASGPNGAPMLGGVFRMHDQHGFGAADCFAECQIRGFKIDWLEALADCWLNDCLKFDAFERAASSCANVNLASKFSQIGAAILAMFPKMRQTPNPVDTVCRYILAKKKLRCANFTI